MASSSARPSASASSYRLRHPIPQHGRSRQKTGAEIVYVEVPGGSHVGVAAPAFAAMLDFFARQQKRAEHP